MYSEHPFEQKPLNYLGEKGVWAFPGTSQFFEYPLLSQERVNATNFKFERYIHRVHPSKSPLKIWEKRERGRIQGQPKFFEYHLLSQEWVKVVTSNLADVFRASMQTKAP